MCDAPAWYERKKAAARPSRTTHVLSAASASPKQILRPVANSPGPLSIVLTIGVALVHSGHQSGDPIAAASSLLVLADTLLFGWLIFRREPAELSRQPLTAPAE